MRYSISSPLLREKVLRKEASNAHTALNNHYLIYPDINRSTILPPRSTLRLMRCKSFCYSFSNLTHRLYFGGNRYTFHFQDTVPTNHEFLIAHLYRYGARLEAQKPTSFMVNDDACSLNRYDRVIHDPLHDYLFHAGSAVLNVPIDSSPFVSEISWKEISGASLASFMALKSRTYRLDLICRCKSSHARHCSR